MNLPIIEQKDFEVSVAALSRHVNDKFIFQFNSEMPIKGISISENMYCQVRRQSHYIDCTFVNSNFDSIGFSGSKFICCKFLKNNYTGANMTSCNFQNVFWNGKETERLEMKRVSFNKSIFSDCTFVDVNIFSCRFMDAVFYNCKFIRCTMRMCSLENTRFNDCSFEKMSFATGNMAFSEFSGLKTTDSIYSFHSLSFTFGLLEILANQSDNNYVYSADSGRLIFSNYIKLFPQFESYYIHDMKYFPLANIYILQKKEKLVFIAIKEGIRHAIQIKDFRMLKYYCKLVYINGIFKMEQRKQLFDLLQIWLKNEALSISEYFQFQLEAQEIRKYLLNDNFEKPTIYLYLKTNIDSMEIKKHDFFLSILENVLLECKYHSKSIEIQHNSNFSDILTIIFENIDQVQEALIMLYGSLGGFCLFGRGINKMIESYQNIKIREDEHKKRLIENERNRLELQIIKENQELEQQRKKLDNQKIQMDIIKTSAEIKKIETETKKMEAKHFSTPTEQELFEKAQKYHNELEKMKISIKISHTSENIKTVPFQEIVQFHENEI